MVTRISSAGISLIKEFEGCRLESYKCHSGVWTIGYGHTAGVKEGQKITQAQAENFLICDLINYEKPVLKYDPIYHFTQSEFDALVSFTYNCGPLNLKMLLKDGKRNRDEIRKALPLYCKSNGKTLAGLQRRRQAELKLFDNMPTLVYFPKYTGSETNLDKILDAIGATKYYQESKTIYKRREPIAKANSIESYKGTAQQNLLLIEKAKRGELIVPSNIF